MHARQCTCNVATATSHASSTQFVRHPLQQPEHDSAPLSLALDALYIHDVHTSLSRRSIDTDTRSLTDMGTAKQTCTLASTIIVEDFASSSCKGQDTHTHASTTGAPASVGGSANRHNNLVQYISHTATWSDLLCCHNNDNNNNNTRRLQGQLRGLFAE
jgi:hypothetical protein